MTSILFSFVYYYFPNAGRGHASSNVDPFAFFFPFPFPFPFPFSSSPVFTLVCCPSNKAQITYTPLIATTLPTATGNAIPPCSALNRLLMKLPYVAVAWPVAKRSWDLDDHAFNSLTKSRAPNSKHRSTATFTLFCANGNKPDEVPL